MTFKSIENSIKIPEIFIILLTQFTRELERGKEGRNPLRTRLTNSFPWSSRRKKKCIRVQALHHPNSNSSLTASNQHQVSASSEAEDDDNDSQPKSDTSQKSPTGFSSIGSPVGSLASPLTPNQVSTVFATLGLTRGSVCNKMALFLKIFAQNKTFTMH